MKKRAVILLIIIILLAGFMAAAGTASARPSGYDWIPPLPTPTDIVPLKLEKWTFVNRIFLPMVEK